MNAKKRVSGVGMDGGYFISVAKLKLEFLRLLTEDSPHQDARRRDFNQAIFDAKEGWACFSGTDLEMVMEKFNKAVENAGRVM